MAKPRTPRTKKTNGDATVPTPSAPASEPNLSATETLTAAETKKPEARKTAPKPETVRSDSRATVVPINLEDEIRRLAYLYSERRGFTPGHETEDWLAAEHEVMQRYHQYSA
jgi:Protein of unknown function (DUF2934)